jgi:putative chitinase
VDLGNTPQKDGDGQRLKGRGIFMTTGTFNYKKATLNWNEAFPDNKKDFFVSPELLELPEYAVWSACQYWHDMDFNSVANRPDSDKILVKRLKREVSPLEYITYRINGGFNHFSNREKLYNVCRKVV